MSKLTAVIINEWLLLWRDKAALLVLFVMPSVLVLVITLVQENVLKTAGNSGLHILFIDQDQQSLSREIEKKLGATETLRLIRTHEGHQPDTTVVKQAVLRGDYQAAIVIPQGVSEALHHRARQTIQAVFAKAKTTHVNPGPAPVIHLYFEPTVMGGVRSAIRNALDIVVLGIEVNAQLKAFSEQLPDYIAAGMEAEIGPFASKSLAGKLPEFDFKLSGKRLTLITESSATASDAFPQPTSVQQNVPAWALFGIFLIAVPIAGSLIRERNSGIYLRLLSFPVTHIILLTGKMAAFVAVCFVQLVLIGFIGLFLLPVLGTPPLEMGASPWGILIISGSAVLAAVSYGIMLGTLANSYEQASMLGPITIVIAAAIGGIMVPVYAMPKFMQTLSNVSPLAWGLNGFLDVFVRGGKTTSVFFDASLLLAFCAACLIISWLAFFRRIRTCGG